MMSIAPYLRPDLDQSADQLPLYITGSLANAKPGQAYEGRLQIYNQIGACSIVSVTGSDVPPGGSWYVDGDELVLQWPEYAENDAPISNPGFESGIDGWTPGAGWSVTTNNPIDGTTSAVFKNAGGESVLSSNSRYPVNGESFSAHCKVRQGASSAGNAGGAVRVEFRNADGTVVGFKDGNRVMSASNNAVKLSNVAITPADYPAGAMTVNIAGLGIRKRQNWEVWADTFSWDYKVAASGINDDTTLCYTVTIRDSAGKTALWNGCVGIASARRMFVVGYIASNPRFSNSSDGTAWAAPYAMSGVSNNGYLGAVDANRLVMASGFSAYYFDIGSSAWVASVSSLSTSIGVPHTTPDTGTVLVPTQTGIARSTNRGVTYTTTPVAWGTLNNIVSKPGLIVAASNKAVYSVNDGVSYSAVGDFLFGGSYSNGAGSAIRDGDKLMFAGQMWVSGVGNCACVIWTTNGSAWDFEIVDSVVNSSAATLATDGAGTIVAVGNNGAYLYVRSPAGVWEKQVTPFSNNVRLAHNGSMFVAAQIDGTIRTSPTGKTGTWTVRSTGEFTGIVSMTVLPA